MISRRNFCKATGLLTTTAVINSTGLPRIAQGSGPTVSMLIDTEKCTGCRVCVLACKQWNNLPLEVNKFFTNEEGKAKLSPIQWIDVVFKKHKNETGKERWLYTRYSCMHCTEAACVISCPVNAMSHNDMGLVEVDRERCIGCNYCISNCPFNVIGLDRNHNIARKCDFCSSRVEKELSPACVEACPAGALAYGERGEMIRMASGRVEELRQNGLPQADIYGLTELDGLKMIYILGEGRQNSETAYALNSNPQIPFAVRAWGALFKPFRAILSLALVFALWMNRNEFKNLKNRQK